MANAKTDTIDQLHDMETEIAGLGMLLRAADYALTVNPKAAGVMIDLALERFKILQGHFYKHWAALYPPN